MDHQIIGSVIIRALSFSAALIFLPLPFAAPVLRIMLALTLIVSSLGQLPSSAVDSQVILSLNTWHDFLPLLPSGSDIAYNIAVGFLFAVLISSAVAAAFLSARWMQQMLQTRFSVASLLDSDDLPKSSLALSLLLAASVFVADFFFQVFSSFNQSFEMFPLLLSDLSPKVELSSQFASALIQSAAEIFMVAFLSSSFLFFAVLVVAVSLLAGVRYVGQAAISITDGGLSLIFMILVLSASVYASSAFIEKAQQEAAAKLSSLHVTQ